MEYSEYNKYNRFTCHSPSIMGIMGKISDSGFKISKKPNNALINNTE